MAGPTKKKGRNFDFDKPQKRTFDFSKEEDLQTPSIEANIAPEKAPIYKKWWFWVVICVVIVACILFLNYKNEETTNIESETVEVASSENVSATNTDSTVDISLVGAIKNETPDVSEVISSVGHPTNGISEPIVDALTVDFSEATSTANISNDVEAEAMKVIRGDYGIGQERKYKLGTKYHIIQNRVNELKREGIF